MPDTAIIDDIQRSYQAGWVRVPGEQAGQTFEQMVAALQAEAFDIMIDRQRKYGPTNITRSENPLYALCVRMGDKLARLEHLCAGGVITADESVDDTLIDLANYALIGMAVHRGWWRKDYCPPLAERAG